MYPGAAGRGRVGSRIAVIAMFGKALLCRESKEESPERPQCGFHISAPSVLPAESIAKPKVHAKMHPCRAISKQTYCKIVRHD